MSAASSSETCSTQPINNSAAATSSSAPAISYEGGDDPHDVNLDLADWEIVSEMLDNSVLVDPNDSPTTTFGSLYASDCDLVVNQLLLLVNRFVDQLSEISLIDAIFEQVLCLDFLLVFVNTPSDRVREIALKTYFKFYNVLQKKLSL